MYVLMGATAQTGAAALALLHTRGVRVRAITSDRGRAASLRASGLEVAIADARDADALAAAFAGATAAFAMVPSYVRANDALAEGGAAAAAVADALRRARVARVVALSSGGAHLPAGTGIVQTLHAFERELQRVGTAITLLRPTDFMENWRAVVPGALASGVLPSVRVPLEKRVEMVSARDVGAVASELLLAGDSAPRVVELRGPREYAPVDVAAAIAARAGREVVAVPMDVQQFVAGTVAGGAGESYATQLGELQRALNADGVPFEGGAAVCRRGVTTLEQVASALVDDALGHAVRATA